MFETLNDWMALLGLGGVLGTILALIAKYIAERKNWRYKHEWVEQQQARERRKAMDRATYHQPLTSLIRDQLGDFVRYGERWSAEDDLRQLLRSLSQGTYEHFLDPRVNRAWEALVAKSVEVAGLRLAGQIREWDIRSYNRIRSAWEDACKRSFGPMTPAEDEATHREAGAG